MTEFQKTLIDVQNRIYTEEWEISNEELQVGQGWRIKKHRLRGGLSDGVDILEVDNGRLSFTVVPTRGMGIWKGTFDGLSLGWDSPVKNLVHPALVDLESRGCLGWLDGFNEWIVRCGINSLGAPGTDIIVDNMGNDKEIVLTLHGKIANLPASFVRVSVGSEEPHYLTIEGVVFERSMFGSNLKLSTSITTAPSSNWLRITDEVENLRAVPDEMEILYHCNFGVPFLEEGARFVAPIRRVAPSNANASRDIDRFDLYSSPQKGFIEQVYFMDLLGDKEGGTKVMILNKDKTKAVSLSFSLKELPCMTLWKNTGALEDGYVTGLEPGTSYPNTRRFEREHNRIVRLMPQEKYHSNIVLGVHVVKEEIMRTREIIEKIRGRTKTVICRNPISDFSRL